MAEVLHQVYAKWDMMSDFIFARVTGFLAGFRISRVVLAELPSRHPELLVGFGSLDGKGFGRIWKVLRIFEAIRMWRKSRFFLSKSCEHHHYCWIDFYKESTAEKKTPKKSSASIGGGKFSTHLKLWKSLLFCWGLTFLFRTLMIGSRGGPETKRIHVKATRMVACCPFEDCFISFLWKLVDMRPMSSNASWRSSSITFLQCLHFIDGSYNSWRLWRDFPIETVGRTGLLFILPGTNLWSLGRWV